MPPYSPPDAENILVVMRAGSYEAPADTGDIDVQMGLDDSALPTLLIVAGAVVITTSSVIGSLSSFTLAVGPSLVTPTSSHVFAHRSDMAVNDFYFSLERSNSRVIFNDSHQRSFYFLSPGGHFNEPVVGANTRNRGKLYFELQPGAGANFRKTRIGLCNDSMGRNEALGETANSWVFDIYNSSAWHNSSTGTTLTDPLPTEAVLEKAGSPFYRERETSYSQVFGIWHGKDVICIAADLDTGKLWVGLNGVWSGDPHRGLNPGFNTASLTGTDLRIVVANGEEKGEASCLLCVLPSEFRWTPPLGFRPWGDPDIATAKVTIAHVNVPTPLTNFPLQLLLDDSTGTPAYNATLQHRVLATLAAYSRKNHPPGFVAFGDCCSVTGSYSVTAIQGQALEGEVVPHCARTLPFLASGRFYYEIKINQTEETASPWYAFGIGAETVDLEAILPGNAGPACSYRPWAGQRRSTLANDPVCVNPSYNYPYGSPISIVAGDVFGFVVDMDMREMFVSYNGAWVDGSDPTTRTNPVFAGFPEDIAYAIICQFGQLTLPQTRMTLVTEEKNLTYAIPFGCKTLAGEQSILARLHAYDMAGSPLDIEITGTNVALVNPIDSSTVAIASSQYASYTGPANAIDGMVSLYWQPQAGFLVDWLRLDFGSGKEIKPVLVCIHFDNSRSPAWPQGHLDDRGITCSVMGSNDGGLYTTLATKTIQQRSIEFDLRETDTIGTAYRYIKLEIVKQNTSQSIQIDLVEVFTLPAEASAEVWVKVPYVSDSADTSILLDFYKENRPNGNIVDPGDISTLPGNDHDINLDQLFQITGTEILTLTTDVVEPFSTDIETVHVRIVLDAGPDIVFPYSTTFAQALGDFVIMRNAAVIPVSSKPTIFHISLADSLTLYPGYAPVTCSVIGGLPQVQLPLVIAEIEIAAIELEAEFGMDAELEIPCIEMEATITYTIVVSADLEISAIEAESTCLIGLLVEAEAEIAAIGLEAVASLYAGVAADMELPAIGIDDAVITPVVHVEGDMELLFLSLAAGVDGGSADEELTMAYVDGGPDWKPYVSA